MKLNYQHLFYFWMVAKNGNLTNTAKQVHIAQSALSIQIKKLEERLGLQLFEREGRQLIMTEAGKIAFTYADDIFRMGNELTNTLTAGYQNDVTIVKIGTVSTLSRNFQERFISPLLQRKDIKLVMKTGLLEDLISALESHELDIILSNLPVSLENYPLIRCRSLAKQAVSVVGKASKKLTFRFPKDLESYPLVLPSHSSDIRKSFDTFCHTHQLSVNIFAEADDMATLRLIARDTDTLAILPKVVVSDEIQNNVLQEYAVMPSTYEYFYALYLNKKYQPNLIKELVSTKIEIT